jgi:glycosyltransferase involved in cell wall biosynthesis
VTRRAAAALRTHAPSLAALTARAVGAAAVPIRSTDITTRLDAARAAIDAFSLLVAPSASMAEEYRRLGAPPDRLRVSDYGFAPQPRVTRAAQPGRPLRAAYMGTLVWHKGVHVILDALRLLPHDAIDVTIFGEPRVSPDYVSELQRQAAGRAVRFAGAFDEAERPALLASVDVIIVPSLWLENSPLVIHEAFMAGVPVIASRIGGITGLVDDGVNGLLVEAGSAAALAAALRKVSEDPALLQRMSAHAPAVKTTEQDAAEWEARYAEVLGKH